MLKKFKSVTKDWALSNKKRATHKKNFRILTMCRKCYTFYYKKSWHFESPNYLRNNDKELPVRFTQCPACLEQEQALFDRESENSADDNFSLWSRYPRSTDDYDGLAWNS